MNNYMKYLICYDTLDNSRRRKIVAALEGSCERVQKSVFEGWMTPRQLTQLCRQLEWVVDAEFDNLRIYRLCRYCEARTRSFGIGDGVQLPRYWVV